MTSTEQKPRDLAKEIIKLNHLGSEHSFVIDKAAKRDELETEFRSWLRVWSYKKDDFKIRLLFAKMIGLDVHEDGKVQRRKVSLGINTDNILKLQLDHMEPTIPEQSQAEKYFVHGMREAIVNGIGNMMPLTKDLNVKKLNKPLIHSFNYYEEFGIKDHMLYKKTRDLEKEYFNNGVPTEEFFSQRAAWLEEVFINLINLPPEK